MNNLHYWQYFIALESDLANTMRYVEPSLANMSCYSLEFARLLLTAGAEVDVLCKLLCSTHGLAPNPVNIKGYQAAIVARFPQFTKLEIMVPRYGFSLYPWQSWEISAVPTWWDAYNEIKHGRSNGFEKANLKNALNAVAGHFVLVSYICWQELQSRKTSPWPQILSLDSKLSSYVSNIMLRGHALPDFK